MSCRPPIRAARADAARGGPALFLDRDGVVNLDHGYVGRPEDVTFVEGVLELCREAARRGHRIVVVTNQAGIGRGYYSEAEFERLTRWMMAELAAGGAALDAVYYCPHHPQAGQGEYRRDCPSRKPGPDMLLAAQDELGIDLGASALVGDKPSDLEAGRTAGVGRLVLLGGDAAGAPAGTLAVATLDEARRAIFG